VPKLSLLAFVYPFSFDELAVVVFALLLGQLAVTEKLLEVISMYILHIEAFQWDLHGCP
jgi:hypothetical protein